MIVPYAGKRPVIDRERVLDLWAQGRLTSGQIALRVNARPQAVAWIVQNARAAGDPRAAYRREAKKGANHGGI